MNNTNSPRRDSSSTPPNIILPININIIHPTSSPSSSSSSTISLNVPTSSKYSLQVTPPSSPTSVRRLSTSVSPPTPRGGSPASSSASSAPPSPPPVSPRKRRNSFNYTWHVPKDESPSSTGGNLIPPRLSMTRRSSAPQLQELQGLARAGISPLNILNLIRASESSEDIKRGNV